MASTVCSTGLSFSPPPLSLCPSVSLSVSLYLSLCLSLSLFLSLCLCLPSCHQDQMSAHYTSAFVHILCWEPGPLDFSEASRGNKQEIDFPILSPTPHITIMLWKHYSNFRRYKSPHSEGRFWNYLQNRWIFPRSKHLHWLSLYVAKSLIKCPLPTIKGSQPPNMMCKYLIFV